MPYIVGVDIGGTFTDIAAIDAESGQVYSAKTPSTPRDLTEGVVESLRLVAEPLGLSPQGLLEQTVKVVHGTTVTSNALLTRDGARTGLITTRGFGDQILIMRARGRVAGLSLTERRHFRATQKPPPIVPKWLIQEVAERVDYKGQVLTPLRRQEAERAVRALLAEGVEAIAVSLLWSFHRPEHERLLESIIRELSPTTFVTLSSDLLPVIGEYERTATTVVNCFVGPTLTRYLERLAARLRELGLRQPLLVLQASGGVAQVEETAAVYTIESGPAAGVVGAKFLMDAAGYPNVIATDMGGTTFKVALLVEGQWAYAREVIINQYALLIPMIDLVSIGAGGGSLAWADGGRLRVGPQSAGADPGPACYGRGGRQPTVTDADVVLGYINPDYFLGGRMKLQPELAAQAIKERVADPLFGGDVAQAALGIRRVVDAQMADLVRKATIERGYDPREFVLMAYGGAGPLHCGAYGPDIGVGRAIVPLAATVHSAFGAAASDVHLSLKLSAPQLLPGDAAAIAAHYQRLEGQAQEALRRQGLGEESIELARWAEMRYRRQMHEVRVPVPAGPLGPGEVLQVAEAFEERYEALYGRGAAYREAGIEMVTFGLDAIGRIQKPPLLRQPSASADASHARRGRRPVCWPELGQFAETAVYDGEALRPGNRLAGPAVVELPGTTVAIHPGQTAQVDEFLNIIIDFGGTP